MADWKQQLSSPCMKLKYKATDDKPQASPLTPQRSPLSLSSKTFIRQFGRTTMSKSLVKTVDVEVASMESSSESTRDTSTTEAVEETCEERPFTLLMPPIAPLSFGLVKPSPTVDIPAALSRLELLRNKAESMASASSQPTESTICNRPALTKLLLESVQSPIGKVQQPDAKPQAAARQGPSEAQLERLQALRREGSRLVNMI